MKSIYLFIFTATVTIICSSCDGENGVDGSNGQAYLNVTANYGVLYAYVDDNTSRPGAFNLGQSYRVLPGTYNFVYESRIYNTNNTYYYSQWIGSYIIHINYGGRGEKGKMFWQKGDPGKNGSDSYLTLLCNFDGAFQSRINKQQFDIPALPDSMIRGEYYFGDYVLSVEYHLKSYGLKEHEFTPSHTN